MRVRLEARESVGLTTTLIISSGGNLVDLTGWTFAATFERQAGAPDFSLAMAGSLSPSVQGFFVDGGVGGRLAMNILPATLQGVDDTTGRFTLNADLLGTPPGGPRQFIAAIVATITEGPTA
jgi:hypothetical protein